LQQPEKQSGYLAGASSNNAAALDQEKRSADVDGPLED
jgi:hypothetical protein